MKAIYSVLHAVIKSIYGSIPDSLATLLSGTRFSKMTRAKTLPPCLALDPRHAISQTSSASSVSGLRMPNNSAINDSGDAGS